MQQVRVLSTTIGGANPGTVTVLKNLAKPIQPNPAVQTASLQKVQITPKTGSILTGMVYYSFISRIKILVLDWALAVNQEIYMYIQK